MALSSSTFQIPLFKHQFFETSQNLRKLNLPTTEIPRRSSFHTARSKSCSPPLRTISCVAGDDGTREASSLPTPISSVFVKGIFLIWSFLFEILFLYLGFTKLNPFPLLGFSDSVSEGRLKKVFSEFGQVTNGESICVSLSLSLLPIGWFKYRQHNEYSQ